MPNSFFIADTHFFHRNIIKYCPDTRGQFSDEIQMNEVIIDNWNKQVKPDDIVYHLGDFAFTNIANAIKLLDALNGRIVIISGNHDHKLIKSEEFKSMLYNIEFVYYETVIEKTNVIMCHYPIRSWNGMAHGSYHLHGHTHGKCQQPGRSLDVGIDNKKNLSLWSWAEIVDFMNDRFFKNI